MSGTRISEEALNEFYNSLPPHKGHEFWNACRDNDVKAASDILDSKVSIFGHNYLDAAIVFNSHEVLKLLLERKVYSPDNLKEALVTAAGNNNTTALAMLLSLEGATPNVAVASNQTPLMVAAGLGQYEACKLLLESKADPTPKHTLFEQTALDFAKIKGYSKIIQLLFSHPSQSDGCLNKPQNTSLEEKKESPKLAT